MIPPFHARDIRRGRSGISLVEMLVAMAVASIIMLLLARFLQTATTTISGGEDQLYATNDAQAALDFIERDLRTVKAIPMPLVLNTQGNFAPEVLQAYNDTAGVATTSTATVTPQNLTIYPMQLLLLAQSNGVPIPASTPNSSYTYQASSVPHLVRYRVAWQDPFPAGGITKNPVFALYRDYVSGDDTFGLGSSLTNAVNQQSTTLGLANLQDLLINYWNVNAYWAGLGAQPPVADLLISNVIDFQILFYDTSPTATAPSVALNYPQGQLNSAASFYLKAAANQSGQTVHLSSQGLAVGANPVSNGGGIIPYGSLEAEIRLTVLSQAGVLQFNSGGKALDNPTLMNNHAHVFMRRVPLNL